jgi:hypothetical protein
LRFSALILAIAAIAGLSAPLRSQNWVQPPLEASNSLLLEMGGSRDESATIGVSGYPHQQSGEFSAFEMMRPAAAQSNAASVASPSVHIDWREKGAVNPVEDTGACGSDWAFSAKGAVEGAHFLATGKLFSLSAQQLLDCARPYGAMGCGGGLPIDGLHYLEGQGAVASADYRYTARDGPCRLTGLKPVINKISGTLSVPIGDDTNLLSMLEKHGPVSVRVEDNWILDYQGENLSCTSRSRSFISALLVGAITRNGEPVWALKFAMGTSFGAGGYAYISRLRPNECGISDDAIVAVP